MDETQKPPSVAMKRLLLQAVKCAECGTRVAEWQGDVLVIEGKHHGETHVTLIVPNRT